MLSLDNIPTLMYTRRLLNGDKLIDVSLSPTNFNNRPLKDHIAGWQIGLQKIAKGGKILLIIPPYLGFGNVAVDKIPSNSILVCELTLVDFK
jgi:FKBP-type peptidyl-prolyl cis-trans isomerase